MNFQDLSIGEIREIAIRASIEEKEKLIDIFKLDQRKGVINIVHSLEKEIKGNSKEKDRLLKLKYYEYKYFNKGARFIAGIDEVGRGPLAGPVYASAVVFPIECMIEGINDSKKLSPGKRKELYSLITDNAICYATGFCDEKTIDKVNILNATYIAMKNAIEKLKIKPQVLLIDALRIPGVDIFQVPIIKGDSLSFSIAAASIIAKVERDELMEKMHNEYPVYNFISNKGYGTREHMEALRSYGPCPLHRKSFISGIL